VKILISQRDTKINGFTFDCLERNWYRLLQNHQLIPVPNIGVIDETIDFDCLVLTGGPDSLARHTTEDLLFQHALDLGKPIIGVCHGAFTVNDLTGGTNGLILGHDNGVHLVEMEGSEHVVNSYHSQCVSTLGTDIIPLAITVDGIEAFKHNSKEIYGIVWHPERMADPVLPKGVKAILGQ
jgi:putative glutamine amidotransferase